MKDHIIKSIHYTKFQRESWIIAPFLLLIFAIGCNYFLISSYLTDYSLLVILLCVNGIIAATCLYCFYCYRATKCDSIAATEEGVIRFNTKSTKFIKYEDIISIEENLFFDEVIFKSKVCSINIPKHSTLFPPFYTYVEGNLFEIWAGEIENGGLSFKGTFKRYVAYIFAICVFLFLSLLFFHSNNSDTLIEWFIGLPEEAIYLSTLVLVFIIILIFKRPKLILKKDNIQYHIAFSKTCLKVDQLISVTSKKYIDYSAELIFQDNSHKQIRIASSQLNYPSYTMMRFIQHYYSLEDAFKL